MSTQQVRYKPEPIFGLSYLVRSWRKTATVFPSFAVGQTVPGISETQGTFLGNNFLEDDPRDIFNLGMLNPMLNLQVPRSPKQFSQLCW